ncbi:MAG TPA: SpoIIE family protein phosphatase [Streptosporangiaceae bacterium]|nr:SpoIIE family protein phosphatase [Streptosporangiaceae bacterium]
MTAPVPTPVLLVEDDDADALLVEELLLDAAAAVTLRRARSLAEAKPLLSSVACVLLDLGLPDTPELEELQGVRWLTEHMPRLAVVVLTGVADEHLGAKAVRAGAQDYLVKGQVDGALLNRVIRYAIERRRSEEIQRQLREAQIYARENSRLERGLLPSPLLSDPRLTVATQYRPGGGQTLLGGDFFDLVEAADGWVHVVVGDVCGRGPEEAALGVCLRVAWRTMVLAGRPMADVLSAVQQVLEHERHVDRMFATLCMMSIAPDRSHGRLHLAGHPQPLLIGPGGVRELAAPVCPPPGISHARDWPASEVALGDGWSLLMYTDGLIEGRIGEGPERLGSEGLTDIIQAFLGSTRVMRPAERKQRDEHLLGWLVGHVRELNGGDLDDDLAVLALGFSSMAGG